MFVFSFFFTDFQEEDVTSSGIDELSALDLVKGKLRALLEEFSDGVLLEDLESAYRVCNGFLQLFLFWMLL